MKDIHYLTKKDLIIGAQLDEGETCLLLTDESKSQYENAMNAKRVREEEEERKRALEETMENASFEQKEIYRIKKEGQDYLKQLAYQSANKISGCNSKDFAYGSSCGKDFCLCF